MISGGYPVLDCSVGKQKLFKGKANNKIPLCAYQHGLNSNVRCIFTTSPKKPLKVEPEARQVGVDKTAQIVFKSCAKQHKKQ